MKFTTVSVLFATAGLVAAQPHNHNHRHVHPAKRDGSVQYDVVHVVMYELNGQPISKAEVDEGLKNGTLVLAANGEVSSVAAAPAAPATSAAAPSYSSASVAAPPAANYQSKPAASAPAYSAPAYSAPASSSSSSSSTGSNFGSDGGASGSDGDWSNAVGPGIDEDFPDGQLSCDQFPSRYGAKAVSWMNLGGWAGVQIPGGGFPGLNKGAITDFSTQVSSGCSDGNCCASGAFCSYACPAGYLKSQWPAGNQGQTGQSVGGIYCNPSDNKLYLTNPTLSKKLCITGASQVNVNIASSLKDDVAVCRTDYPGQENMNIPTAAIGGSGSNETTPLACVSGSSYYHWQGANDNANYATSGQYYVNPSKYSVSEGCWWNNAGTPAGNFAPVILGVGVDSSNKGWFAIQSNSQKPDGAELDFGIRVESNDGTNFCEYTPGKGFTNVLGTNSQGCTVEIDSGDVTYNFFPSS
ncbi:glycoside hydrolase family 132 protein [Viridothelium virens]|uniref:Glycoside hydrolase family 132 protein n=1 Tax=Viridothelium virens TaxID=1048519 RepID=A0A6A6HIZ3_VIRVR|nr:glycoside hydrolase family 132 protein [Viridothelium virens]